MPSYVFSNPYVAWDTTRNRTNTTMLNASWQPCYTATVLNASWAATNSTMSYQWIEKCDSSSTTWTSWSNDWWNRHAATGADIQQAYRDARAIDREDRRRQLERDRLRSVAQVKAHTLLLGVLDEQQQADFQQANHFYVTSSTGRTYEVILGRAHNVFEVDVHRRRIVEYCGHVGEAVPNEDNLVAQKLMLELDEPSFLRTANRWELHGARRTHTQRGLEAA